ncbi:anti-sigma factor [Halalkalibacillus halophilus]|uniref:anti-sigma factor n=1 Tax=Halalkalibacillus halophilus TaxID=392827 RepID=UPI0003FB6F98|nr:anti-sigma factor [Halalkalibacillus halophilus]
MSDQKQCELLIDYFNQELSESEKQAFEAHLETCDECKEELAELNALNETLPFASEPVDPPEGMKERILANVLAEETPTKEETDSNDEKVVPYTKEPKRKRSWILPSIAAVLILSLLGNAYFLFGTVDDVAEEDPGEEEPIEEDPPEEDPSEEDPVEEDPAEEDPPGELTDRVTHSVTLNATEYMNAAGQASILENELGRSLLIQAENLESLEGDEAYQVWLLEGEEPYRAGTFVPDEEGRGAVSFSLDDLEDVDYDTVAITLEPSPDNEQPEGEILLVSEL